MGKQLEKGTVALHARTRASWLLDVVRAVCRWVFRILTLSDVVGERLMTE